MRPPPGMLCGHQSDATLHSYPATQCNLILPFDQAVWPHLSHGGASTRTCREGWGLCGEVAYPARPQNPCVREADRSGDGRQRRSAGFHVQFRLSRRPPAPRRLPRSRLLYLPQPYRYRAIAGAGVSQMDHRQSINREVSLRLALFQVSVSRSPNHREPHICTPFRELLGMQR